MKSKTLLVTTAIITATTAAFSAASLKVPQKNGTTAPTSTTARAGTMRAQTMKTSSVSAPNVTTTQSIATPISTETTDARIALLKGIKGFNPGKIKDTAAAQQELNNINSQIEELQAQLDRAEAAQSTVLTTTNVDDKITASVESKTYTKAEIDDLLSNVIKKLPQLDDRGNMTWTDPNGNLVVVHVGDVVIGGDDIIIVDGNLSTTSTHPVQNKVVTNALNEKQNHSTTLSFGAANGEWIPVTLGSDYIELHNTSDSKEIRIRPSMIATSLENMENEDQLITAGAVQEAIAALTTNSGGNAQPEYYFNLLNVTPRFGGLVTRYTYETNASYNEILSFAEKVCSTSISDKWCYVNQLDDHTFRIVNRHQGHDISDYTTTAYTDTNGHLHYGAMISYAANLPEGVAPQTYVNENLCTGRSNTCYMFAADYTPHWIVDFNDDLEPLYYIDIYLEYEVLTELPEKYKEENQQTLDD